ncbi:hypothetical protein SALBM311S_02411 [Streptomyces alboniger]
MSDSSRDTAEGAGWGTAERGEYQRLMPSRVEKISWLNPKTLWAARNGVVASWFGDPTGRIRSRWVAQRAAAGAPADKVIRRDDPDEFCSWSSATRVRATIPSTPSCRAS